MRGRIVVVNFGSEDLKRTKAALSEEQFEVVPAATPTEALKALDRGVVAGLVLPTILQGMDAERLAAIARHHNHNLLLVFGCTSRIEEDYLKSRFKPPLACLQLPWDRQALSFAVRSGTDQSAAKFSRDSTAVRDSGETHTGNTSDRPFGTLLVELLEAGSTGMLSLANAAVRKTVYFVEGVPTYAESNLLGENLGRFLVQRGVITDSDLARARSVQLAEGIKQGEALVKIGALSHAQLFELLRQQIEEKIVNCFALDHATFEFKESDDFLGQKLRFELNPLSILIQGFDRFQDSEAVKARREQASTIHIAMGDPKAGMWRFTPTALPKQFSDWLQNRLSLADIMTATGWTAGRVSAVITAVVDAGMCRVVGSSSPAETTIVPSGQEPSQNPAVFDSGVYRRLDVIMRMYLQYQSGSYYDVLDVPRKASATRIQQSHQALLERFAEPDFNRGIPQYARAKVREIVEKIRAAGDVLLDVERRKAYDNALDRPGDATQTDRLIEAEVRHVLGLDLLTEKDFAEAEKCFKQAFELNPDEPTYQLYLGWAAYQSAQPGSLERVEAVELVSSAVDLNPLIDMGYHFLGMIHLEEDQIDEAREQFEIALHFNPDNEAAKTALDSLDK